MSDKTRLENARKPRGDYGRNLLDEMNAGTHARLSTWAFERLAAGPGLPHKDAHCLDVGCGGGANLGRLLALVPAGEVVGVDYSPISVEKSSATCADAIAVGRCRVLEGNVSALPLDDASFDMVSAFETIYFWPSLEQGLSEIARVLRVGGTLMVCCETDGYVPNEQRWEGANEHPELLRIYSVDEIEQTMRAVGLVPCGHERHAEEGWIVVFARRS
jgi:ubiquinone/menaquinone biosynthesis C-methylase UbiE